ncbi:MULTISPECIES: enoyl-CoA hydratase [Clostridia]|uniref:enoyl-CoA hydratase n=1 Tax=Clostridia TaxID=186801 RepID=UPI000EA0CAED|nr:MULTISPECIES: enoyl-CoA hydratase [Clostridia]NBJ69926.1 enoyl-CoA hydratase [Roseburia sp. 1XD42-34]RKI77500.1 enoyl-CoA hydratase [Clostridium sp. 1xD42-85]
MGKFIDLQKRQSVAIVKINRPEAANALSQPLLEELQMVLQKVEQDESIFCTILTGEGEKAFCAGADLKERATMTDQEVISAVTAIGDTVTMVENLSMPLIAALNGVAFGGGLELALACDIRIAARHVKMGLTETSLAIIPGAGGTQRLPRLIGIGQAKRLIYSAKRITAEKAFQLGLVEEVVEGSELHDRVKQFAVTIAKNGPIALRQAKMAINKGMETDLATGLLIERLAYQQTIPTNDRHEGLQAFREKRTPNYQGN